MQVARFASSQLKGDVEMPYTKKEKKLMASLRREYGAKRAVSVYHAMLNSGKYDELFGARSKRERDAKRKKRRRKK